MINKLTVQAFLAIGFYGGITYAMIADKITGSEYLAIAVAAIAVFTKAKGQ